MRSITKSIEKLLVRADREADRLAAKAETLSKKAYNTAGKRDTVRNVRDALRGLSNN